MSKQPPNNLYPPASLPIRLIISALIGVIAWQLAVVIPQPITYQGVDVGNVGVPLVGLRQWLNGEPVYRLQTIDGVPIVNNPFTTMLIMSPFLFVPLEIVVPTFCALSSAVLAFGLTKNGELWRLLVFLSFPFISSIHSTQWAPLFMAALLLPGLLPIAVAKPQLGLVLALNGKWRKSMMMVAVCMIVLSFALYPTWLWDWFNDPATRLYGGWIPALTIPGFLLVLLARYWRSERARLLLTISLAPQRMWYDQLLVFLIPSNWKEMMVLTINSWAAVIISRALGWINSFGPQDWRAQMVLATFLYLPALWMVLWEQKKRPKLLAQEQPLDRFDALLQ
jgi:hypothetical protein